MLKLRIFDVTENFSKYFLGPIYRNLGKRLIVNGLQMQGSFTSDDRLVPSLRCRAYKKQIPKLGSTDFVAPNSVIVGNVELGENSSVWYGATLRGDLGKITVGQQSIIQDLVQITPNNNQSVEIGDSVLIGPNSNLESCKISNNSFVGMGSTIRNGAQINSNTVIAAGAVVVENSNVQTNQIWAGNPAQYLRDLTPEEQQVITEHHQETLELARIHSEETEKSFRQIIDDLDERENQKYEDEEAKLLREIQKLGLPMNYEDEDYIEQRVFLKEARAPKESEFFSKNYDPYEQDLENFPDSFKKYGVNYERVDEINKYFEQNPNTTSEDVSMRFNPDKIQNNDPWTRKY